MNRTISSFHFRSILFVYTGETLIFEQSEAHLFAVGLAKKYVWVEFSRTLRNQSPVILKYSVILKLFYQISFLELL